jgi:streptomycin 3"-adenylyltransferase
VPPALSAKDGAQVEAALASILNLLGDEVLGVYVYGSAMAGGLHPRSDIDLLVVTRRPATPLEAGTLIETLMALSGRRAVSGPARSLEVTVVVQSDVRPWRYPARLDLQYGDWFREDYERGNFAPWESPNPDLAVLLTTALAASEALVGPDLGELVDPVPTVDLDGAMVDVIPGLLADLDGDEANVLLTLARIWNTLATGAIHPKDVAADWALARLAEAVCEPIARARAIYLGDAPDQWDDLRPGLQPTVDTVVSEIRRFNA